jgi:hypothetical protein
MATNPVTESKMLVDVANAAGAPDLDEIARSAYHGYARSTHNKNFQGNEMPAWEALPEAIRVAWAVSVKTAIRIFLASAAGDLGCFLRAYSRGEPTFTLIGRDPTSFATIVFWILQNPEAPAEKLREAFNKADLCREWPDKKAAD